MERALRLLLLLLLGALFGCGPSGPKTYKIPGKVVDNTGAPVTEVSVVLQTTLDGKVIPALGMTDSAGKFELTTFIVGDGIVAGEHDVAISPMPIPDGVKPTQPPVPKKYWDFSTSGLKQTVTPEMKEIEITIDRNAK